MRRSARSVWIATVLIVAVVATDRTRAQPPGGPIDAAQVLDSIDRGIAYLKREQTPRGHWGEMAGYTGGVTALCTLALLNAGVPADDPTIVRALDYLRQLKLEKTYVVSLQTMVFAAADPKKDMLLIDRNVRWLESKQSMAADRKGAWSYPGPGGDNSNSQFAVLALFDAQSVGAKVKRQTWQFAADYWRNTQNDDGSWGYVPGDAGSGSMTCAGIGALATSTAALESGDATVERGRVICCRPHKEDRALERAVDWLAQHFSVRENPRPEGSGQDCLYYYLYGLERAGRLTARRFIGDHDWYREGAEYLVRDQDPLSHYWIGTWH
ncbi:MAG: prenyltransferase/squalene oxidase repeat-containing protein, partial [Pirellulales bacterium]